MKTTPSVTVTTIPATTEKSSTHVDPSQPVSRYRLAPERAREIRNNPPQIMTVLEAAEVACVSPRRLRDLLRSRTLKSSRVGGRIVIRKVWLDAMIGD